MLVRINMSDADVTIGRDGVSDDGTDGVAP